MYSHLSNKSSGSNAQMVTAIEKLKEAICRLLSAITRFDFFPTSPAIHQIIQFFNSTHAPEEKCKLYSSVIFRNLSQQVDFRKLLLDNSAISAIFTALQTYTSFLPPPTTNPSSAIIPSTVISSSWSDHPAFIDKLAQGLYIISSDYSNCTFAKSLSFEAAKLTLNPLIPLLSSPLPSTRLFISKVINNLASLGLPHFSSLFFFSFFFFLFFLFFITLLPFSLLL